MFGKVFPKLNPATSDPERAGEPVVPATPPEQQKTDLGTARDTPPEAGIAPDTASPAADAAAAQDADDGQSTRRGTFHHPGRHPRTVEECGLTQSFVTNLVAKILHSGGTMTPAQISGVIKLPKIVCRQVIQDMTDLMLVEAQGLEAQDIKSDIRYRLTDLGVKWALDAQIVSQYVGPAPVTLEAFDRQIRSQSISLEELHHSELDRAFSHLIIPEILKAQLGPASNSGRSMLLYGEPGNGKTSLAEALGDCFVDTLSFPYAILIGNQVIRFFDETLHERVDPPADCGPMDQRWVPCRRPVVVAGGEMSLNMLDLSFDTTTRFYEAPMHLKALGGVFVLDDFGRQLEEPQAYLNRWIVPLEKGFDILSLHTGKKFTVPFDQLVVFSSNLQPTELGDDAALRRIYFKIFVPSPTREDYLQIFRNVCAEENIAWQEDVMQDFYQRKYEEAGFVTSGAHPGFLMRHILAACRYLEREPELSTDLLELAWRNVAASRRRDGKGAEKTGDAAV